MQRWEYLSLFIKADAKREEEFLRQLRDWKDGLPAYTPEAMIPELNALGEDGWELVHMQPAYVGEKRDVLMVDSGSGGRAWANQYFCVFKRPIGSTDGA